MSMFSLIVGSLLVGSMIVTSAWATVVILDLVFPVRTAGAGR